MTGDALPRCAACGCILSAGASVFIQKGSVWSRGAWWCSQHAPAARRPRVVWYNLAGGYPCYLEPEDLRAEGPAAFSADDFIGLGEAIVNVHRRNPKIEIKADAGTFRARAPVRGWG